MQEQQAKTRQDQEAAAKALQDAEAKQRQEQEAAARALQDAQAKQRQEQEAAARALQDAEAAKRQHEQEAAAQALQDAEAAKQRQEQEAAARALQDAQAAKRRQEQHAAAQALQDAQAAKQRQEQEAAARALQDAEAAKQRQEQEAAAKALQDAKAAKQRQEQEAAAKALQDAEAAKHRQEQEAAEAALRAQEEAGRRSLLTRLKAVQQKAYLEELQRLRQELSLPEPGMMLDSVPDTQVVASPSTASSLPERAPTEEWNEDAQDPLAFMPRRQLFPPTPIKGTHAPAGHLLVTPEAQPMVPPAPLPSVPKPPTVLQGSSAFKDLPKSWQAAKEPTPEPPKAAAKKSMPAPPPVPAMDGEQPSKSALDKRIRRALQPDSRGNYKVRQEIVDQWATDREGVFKLFASCGNDSEARLNYPSILDLLSPGSTCFSCGPNLRKPLSESTTYPAARPTNLR